MMKSILIACLSFVGCDAAARDVTIDSTIPAEATENAVAAADSDTFTPANLEDFAGAWEASSDDGTSVETAEIEIQDGVAVGALKSLERGYFSGRVTVNTELAMRGTLDNGRLVLQVWDAENGNSGNAVSGRAFKRGEYLVVQAGSGESNYARPGISLVQSAEGSASAMNLAKAITGNVYSTSSQAAGGGAFVGGRVRFALCADGSIEYDASDVATTGGNDAVDMGSSTSRRGQWSIVLYAGKPAVQARWNGTGTSYSLTRYFRVDARANGARVDGMEMRPSGSC